MQHYQRRTDSKTRTNYGYTLAVGLREFPETRDLAPALEAMNERLDEAANATAALVRPITKAQATIRFAAYHANSTVRSLHGASKIADGGRAGPITAGLFPHGLGPELRAKGSALAVPVAAILERLVLGSAPGVDAVRTEWRPKLESALARLSSSIAAYDEVKRQHDAAFARECAARDEHVRAIDVVMGQVRAAFPRDREKQDSIFPRRMSRSRTQATPPSSTTAA